MPTESELRARFHAEDAADPAPGAIDLDAVLRRTRSRRRPRVVAVALVSSLAALGIVVPVSLSVLSGQTGSLTTGSAASAPDVESGGGKVAPSALPGDRAWGCGLPGLPSTSPSLGDLSLTVAPVVVPADFSSVVVPITMTNSGQQRVSGVAASEPSILLIRNGVVYAVTDPAPHPIPVDLAPGASLTFETTLGPLTCGPEDASGVPGPSAPSPTPGVTQLQAVLEFSSTGVTGSSTVTGPPTAFTVTSR